MMTAEGSFTNVVHARVVPVIQVIQAFVAKARKASGRGQEPRVL